jgi:hypothetical protein
MVGQKLFPIGFSVVTVYCSAGVKKKKEGFLNRDPIFKKPKHLDNLGGPERRGGRTQSF